MALSASPSSCSTLLVLLFFCFFITPTLAFGAGALPPTSEYNGYVWRHGDVSEILRYLPVSFITAHRFTKLQRRQIYFGNWLRDFSQVVDTTCLEVAPEPILRAIVAVLAFMEFGFATDEFEVTKDRLGCYTHVEHIDNPRGYVDNAKSVDPRLRGPVDPRELEFDPKTGMKNYIANTGNGYDTSADYVRRQLGEAIKLGRQSHNKHSAAAKESFIHLGAALHTLEDFAAHSNFVELCLRQLGEDTVFPLVGDACRVKVPGLRNKKVAPLVTGTFGMLDIFHSFLGEAHDMAVLQSRGNLGDLEEKLQSGGPAFDQLFDLIKSALETLSQITANSEPLLQQLNTLAAIFRTTEASKTGEFNGEDQGDSSSSLADANTLWQPIRPIFYPHDTIKKWLLDREDAGEENETSTESTNEIGEYTTQMVWKYLRLMIESSVVQLRNAVKAAKEKVDEEAAKSTSAEVYQDGSDASDPSHSDLSKDHYGNVLNQPAGIVATIITNWTTQQVVKCWDDPTLNADAVIDEILAVLHHPDFAKKKSPIQSYMFDAVKKWWEHHSDEGRQRLREKLTKESVQVREHEDHHLTLKDLEGTWKGAGEFPGCRPEVKNPPRKPSLLADGANVAITDTNWIFVQLLNYTRGLRLAALRVTEKPDSYVGGVARVALSTTTWVIGGVYTTATKLWPFRRRN